MPDWITSISTWSIAAGTAALAVAAIQAKNVWEQEVNFKKKHEVYATLYGKIKQCFRDTNTFKRGAKKLSKGCMNMGVNVVYQNWDDFYDNNDFISYYLENELFLTSELNKLIEDFRIKNFNYSYKDYEKIEGIIIHIELEMKKELGIKDN